MVANNGLYRFAMLGVVACYLMIALGGCAELQRKPEFSTTEGNLKTPIPLASQQTRVALRVVQGKTEARLSEPLLCGSDLPPYQKVSYELSTQDNIWRWTGFVGAGLTAALVGVGMATGQDPTRGVVILGAWGIPLAGLGTYETLREYDVTEPTYATASHWVACPTGVNQLKVRIRAPQAGEEPVLLSSNWTAVSLPESGITQDGLHIPIVADETGLSAYVPPLKVKGLPPGPLFRAAVYSPPAVASESTVLSVESEEPAANDAAAPKKAR